MHPVKPTQPASPSAHLVLIVSDGTGITGERVVQAAMTQFNPASVMTERVPQVRDAAKILAAVKDAADRRATILYSLVSPEHRRQLVQEARLYHIPTIDLLGSILLHLEEVLEVAPRAEPGLFHQLDEEYFRRIESIDYAVKHDDGRCTTDLDTADLVLVGVSRTSKTPLAMFLAYRGWHVANIPIILGFDPPHGIFEIPRTKVVALMARPHWLEGIRGERVRRMSRGLSMSYAEPAYIKEELAWFHQILARGGWTVLDVTNKAVEETAAEIIALYRG